MEQAKMPSRTRIIYRQPGGGVYFGRRGFERCLRLCRDHGGYDATLAALKPGPIWQQAVQLKKLIPSLNLAVFRERRGVGVKESRYLNLIRENLGMGRPIRRQPTAQSIRDVARQDEAQARTWRFRNTATPRPAVPAPARPNTAPRIGIWR